MRPFLFRPSLSRAISTQPFTHNLLSLLTSLSQTPTNPKTLASLSSLLSQSQPLDSSTSILALRGLALINKLTRSKSILAQSKFIPSLFLYSTLLQCTLRNATLRDVETHWPDLKLPPISLSDFITHLCRHCENVAEIEKLYWRISSNRWWVSQQALEAIIGAMCRINDPNRHLGRVVLSEMETREMEVDDLTYFAVFRSFCSAGNVGEADSVLRDWRRQREFTLGCSIYGWFFYGLCKSGKFREARKLFDKMTTRGCDGRTSSSSPLLRPGRRAIFQLTYPGVISDVLAFEAYFRSLCRFGRVGDAERLLSVAMKKDIVPKVCVCNCFVKALFRAGRVDDALRFFESERRKGHVCTRDIAGSVILGLFENGKPSEGRNLLNEMLGEGFIPTASIWNEIIRISWETGSEEAATVLFDDMRSGKCEGYRARPDTESYSMMICKFLQKGEIDKGMTLLDEMAGKKLKAGVELYSGIVRGLHKCGRVEECNKWLNQMIEDGTLVSYEGWESLYDSMVMDGEVGELWKAIEANKEAREGEERRLKRK